MAMNESLERIFPVSNIGYFIGLLKQASGFGGSLAETDRVPALAALHTFQTAVSDLDEELRRRGQDRATYGGVEDDLKWIDYALSTLDSYLNRSGEAVDGATAYVFAAFLELQVEDLLGLLQEIDQDA